MSKLCDYCQTDRDGYTKYLPRIGTGNAHISKHPAVFGGWLLRIRWPLRAEMKIQINYCPMCGRKLLEELNGRE